MADGVSWLKVRADIVVFVDSFEFLRKITVVGDGSSQRRSQN